MRSDKRDGKGARAQQDSPASGPSPTAAAGAGSAQPVEPPAIALPKGGGAMRGIGEKFAANPATGTGSMSVPLATSPGRSGFGPQLSLSYDSGAGNGAFGFGWSLSVPAITRKTDKGLPRYQDALDPTAENSDVFMLSGAEDLVPVLEADGNRFEDNARAPGYVIHQYRPRVEGLFARIERWTRRSDGDVHWRSISRDNVLTLYGLDENSRIADPDNVRHVFSWLICETRDDKGNAILYGYKAEDGKGVELGRAQERNRGDRDDRRRRTNRYLKHIRYGNEMTLLDDGGLRPRFLSKAAMDSAVWLFEVVFDYGEHDADEPSPNDAGDWLCRNDPFSSYRAGFEVRTYRLCQRVLMFHHFAGEPEVGKDCLVRSTDFSYRDIRKNPSDASRGHPIASFVAQVTQGGYKRAGANGYLKRSLPPLEFEYSQAEIQDDIREVDASALENLPTGLDGAAYQWVDLDGEGISGILTEQAATWFYKPNLGGGHFGPLKVVTRKPAVAALGGGQQQLLDLDGDGQLELVQFDGPMPGFQPRTHDESWEPFQPFAALPNIPWNDPNLRFADLNGDGHADVMITEHQVFTWYPSLAKGGFAPAEHVSQPWDEEEGPRLVFADGTQSIYLADMSGDGLTDLARIRNGEICYWPNLGYGNFGAKVTMDNSPWFDTPDRFDQRRIRIADIDGSGTTDVIYLSASGASVYCNQSGNAWSVARQLPQFPRVDKLSAVTTADLLGNGTACLVWSSPLPGDTRRPLRYIDLMGGQKPHLLIKSKNNLGAETRIEYAPSTRFYLADKLAGKPWVTKLPFPVHCVVKVTVTDKWRQTSFASNYSYHHGYFDGVEREFRGFGRVEQVDSETYGEFAKNNAPSPYITQDKTLYQPPVKTVSWFHTGALRERERILSQLEQEYFPHWFEAMRPGEQNVLGGFQENALPEPDIEAGNLSADEWREALRACKGMLLRQEVCELDVAALDKGEHLPVKLFSTAYHNCHIRRLQAKGRNAHAVFLVVEGEAMTHHYELDLATKHVSPDPRIAHTLNLKVDEQGNVLQAVAIGYGRVRRFGDDAVAAEGLSDVFPLIDRAQQERHLVYTETRYTEDFASDQDNYRLRVPCEVLTYELTGIDPEDVPDAASPDARDNLYFDLAELRGFQLSSVHQLSGTAVAELQYHQQPNRTSPQKRLIEHVRTLFFKDAPADAQALKEPLPFRQLGRLGLPYETYKLALTDNLLNAIFAEAGRNKLDEPLKGLVTARQLLGSATVGGYLAGPALAARFTGSNTAGQYWIRTGTAGFAPDSAQHFYLPELYTDPFGNVTTLSYDGRDLFVASSSDALGNTVRVARFDFRVLAPRETKDINDNLSEAFFDVLGLPTAMAVKGKGNEADDLLGFTDALGSPTAADLSKFFEQADLDETRARLWLGNASARHVYYFGETRNPNGTTSWAQHPACACAIVREQHTRKLAPAATSPIQAAFEYSDGLGAVLAKKVQAEPGATGQPLRWVASGKTVLNNKGKPVKQYEPYFSPPAVGHRFEEPPEVGVTPITYYDAVGRAVRTEMPDGSLSRVEFSAWHVRSFDQNDTVKEPGNAWFARNSAAGDTAERKRAAQLAAAHAATPGLTLLDSLGRAVISVAHNRVKAAGGALVDERYVTFTKLDAEGKPLWIRDARSNLVMQYIRPLKPLRAASEPDPSKLEDVPAGSAPCYDIAGNLLFQHSMDAGSRWMLNDAAGKSLAGWNSRGHTFRTEYDPLHRPLGSFVRGTDPLQPAREIQSDKAIYGDTPGNGLSEAQKAQLNLRGKPYQQHDSAGIVTSKGRNPATGADEAFDFKGNLLRSTRQLAHDYKSAPDWSQAAVLEPEIFTSSTAYDALSRPTQLVAPHSDRPNTKCNVSRPGYNAAGLLETVNLWLERAAEPTGLLDPATASSHAVLDIDHDAKGQRTRIEYGNGVTTAYSYDPLTFRLVRLQSLRGAEALQDLSYTYDPVGNITHIHDYAQPSIFFNGDRVEPSSDYTYDALYRLVEATGREHLGQLGGAPVPHSDSDQTRVGLPWSANASNAMGTYVEQYQYDPVGNFLFIRHRGSGPLHPGWKRCYQYAFDSNRLLSTSNPAVAHNPETPCPIHYAANPVYVEKYEYDAHGSMQSMPHLPLMKWDHRDQLQATFKQVVKTGTPETTWYVYDAGGQRVRKVTELQAPEGEVPKRKAERIYLGGFEVWRSFKASGTDIALERDTLHVMDDQQRIALVETRTEGKEVGVPPQLVRFQLGNHLGSSSLELDEKARIISYEEYTPYGSTSYQAVRSQTETPKRYRYTGKERDEESGFTYHGARYYAPWLGRWTAADPAGLEDSINVFQFARARPVILTDPTGRNSVKADRATEFARQIGTKVVGLMKEEFTASEKLVDAESKVSTLEYKLGELRTEEIRRGLQNDPKHIRQLNQAEHNLAQATKNLAAARTRFNTVKTELAAAYSEFTDALRSAAKAGAEGSELVSISQHIEREFEALIDVAEMSRPDWKAAAKAEAEQLRAQQRGSGKKEPEGGPVQSAPTTATQPFDPGSERARASGVATASDGSVNKSVDPIHRQAESENYEASAAANLIVLALAAYAAYPVVMRIAGATLEGPVEEAVRIRVGQKIRVAVEEKLEKELTEELAEEVGKGLRKRVLPGP